MSSSQFTKTPVISGFVGENVNLPELQLPPTVSPSALNTDYYRKTLLKRAGFLRMDDRPQTHGGISARVAAARFSGGGNVLGTTSALTYPAYWALSFSLYVHSATSTSGDEIFVMGTPATDGIRITWHGTYYRCTFETSGGAKTLDVTADADQIVGILVVYRLNDAATNDYYFYVNTDSDSVTASADAFSKPGTIYLRYMNTSSETMDIDLDEIRLWNLGTLTDATYATWLTGWTTDLNYKRQLTASEAADSKLDHYWRLNQDEFVVDSTYFTPTVGTINFYVPVVGLGFGSRDEVTCMGRSLVSMPYDGDRPFSTALFYHSDQWFQLGAEAWQYAAEDATLAAQRTPWSEFGNIYSGPITGRQWSWCRFRNRIVAVHPQVGCFYTQSGSAFMELVPINPPISGVTAGDLGSGSGPGVGDYSFKFYYQNSTTGVTGLSSTSPVSVSMATAYAIQLSGLGTIAQTRRALAGIDTLLIFRTKAGGSVYYLVHSITLSASPSATESGTEINTADADLSELETDVALGYILAEQRAYKARACFTLRGRIALWGVSETATYNSTDIQTNLLYVSEAITTNLYATDRRYEVEPDEHDYAIGGIAVPGGALLAKRYSLCSLQGAEPSSYIFDTFSHEFGCLSHNTISDSDKAIYLLSDYGIVAVSKGLNDAVNVTQDAYKPVFDDLDPSSLDVSCGIFWKAKSQYWCSFNTVTDGRITLVYNEKTGAISKYDLAIEAFYIHQPDGAAPQLYGTWRGYRVRLDYGNRDGGSVDSNVVDIEGTVTAATSETLTDSGQSWRHPLSYYQTAYADVFSLLNGHTISVVNQTTGVIQTRTILWNNATKIWVTAPWDTTPTAGDTYYISGIDWTWRTPLLSLEGDRSGEEKFKRLYGWLNRSQTVPITLSYLSDTNAAQTKTIAGDARFFDELIPTKGRETYVGFANAKPDAPVEIEAFQIGFEEGRVRP